MVFAIMRNGHEVIRGTMIDVEEFIQAGEWGKAYNAYSQLAKWEGMHKLMEEGNQNDQTPKGVFSVLDENFNGVAKENGMRESHTELDRLEEKVDEAADVYDNEAFAELFKEFSKANDDHMKAEESIMEPKVKQLKMSGVDLKGVITNEVLALVVSSPDFKFFVQHAVAVLEKHHGNMPRARVFSHALSACATTEQWEEWRAWIKESVSEKMYEDIVKVTG